MKVTITLKDPDGVWDSLLQHAMESVSGVTSVTATEKLDLIDRRREQISRACEKWIQYGEYVTIEIDTDAGTAVVKEAK